MTPVHDIARWGEVQMLRAALDADPGLIEAETTSGLRERPLHCACEAGCVEAVQLLLDRGAGIDSRDSSLATPLLRACSPGRSEVVALLLERGADPTLRSAAEWTVLISASSACAYPRSDHVAVIRRLLKDSRVPVDARDRSGCTALFWACYMGQASRARVLLVEGRASYYDVDLKGQSAWDVIQRHHLASCGPLLQWYEGEMEKIYLLSRARAMVDAAESISKAPEKMGAETEAEAQKAREKAAPAYLRGRVERGEALPVVEVGGQVRREEEEECHAVCQFVVRHLKDDLQVELMTGLRYR